MDLKNGTLLSTKSDRERQILYDIACMWYKKNGTNELIYKTERESETQKTNLQLLGGKREGTNQKIGIDMFTLLNIKWIIDKDLLYSTGNSTQYLVMIYMGKEF